MPLLLAAAALLGGGLYLLLRPVQGPQFGSGGLPPAPAPAAPAATPSERVLRLSGQTSARNFSLVLVPVFRGPDSGRDLTLLKAVPPGSFVKKGQIIAELDAQSLQDHIDDVRDLVQQAENDVTKRRALQEVEWESLQQNLRAAKAELDKTQLELKAAEVKTEIEREILRLTAEEAEANYKQLLADLDRKRIAHRAEIRVLEITLRRQQIHLGNHVHDIERFVMRAPIGGLTVMSQVWRGEMRQIQEGDQVSPGQQIMRIVDISSMQVEATVSQTDSDDLRVGQTAIIGLDAFPELKFTGRITSMGALAVKGLWDTYYIRNIPVRVAIEGSDPRLIPDLSAWAEVRLEADQQASLR